MQISRENKGKNYKFVEWSGRIPIFEYWHSPVPKFEQRDAMCWIWNVLGVEVTEELCLGLKYIGCLYCESINPWLSYFSIIKSIVRWDLIVESVTIVPWFLEGLIGILCYPCKKFCARAFGCTFKLFTTLVSHYCCQILDTTWDYYCLILHMRTWCSSEFEL